MPGNKKTVLECRLFKDGFEKCGRFKSPAGKTVTAKIKYLLLIMNGLDFLQNMAGQNGLEMIISQNLL